MRMEHINRNELEQIGTKKFEQNRCYPFAILRMSAQVPCNIRSFSIVVKRMPVERNANGKFLMTCTVVAHQIAMYVWTCGIFTTVLHQRMTTMHVWGHSSPVGSLMQL